MQNDADITPLDRCRLVLCMGPDEMAACNPQALREILSSGDVASVIFSPNQLEEEAFQEAVEALVTTTQDCGVAAVIADQSRIAGRVGADGLQLGQDPAALEAAIDKFSPRLMVGAANVKTRHNALTLGELHPDYLMFGKPGGDIRPEPHPKNLDLGQWWSQMVEIPCIVMGGSDPQSALAVAETGAEFVALGNAIFAPDSDAMKPSTAASRVKHVNELLDQHAPRFETVED
ncbi:MAG: thiamine phosphate synthase [Rhizobiaceae bacterium]|nr:thiamine phosphate synthase [Rhizobiaceae bacterium]